MSTISTGDVHSRPVTRPAVASGGRALEVCLVGAGPRGLSLLERLIARERRQPRWQQLTVHVVDPDRPGAGRVWRLDQSRHLLMNTVASQVTVFTDASVQIDGPLEQGPSLYEWARALTDIADASDPSNPDDPALREARALGPDTYPTRALYGQYLTWAFRHVAADAPAHVRVRVHPSRAVSLDDADPVLGRRGPQTVRLEDGTKLTGLGAVLLAQGHVPVHPTAEEWELLDFAVTHGLTYVPPVNPADVDVSGIVPGETVLLRGLGLAFFDYMALFTHARGGTFQRVGGRLVYCPSGREPHLVAGSRRGVPYQARGENQKGAHGRYTPRLLTAEYVAALRTPTTAREPVRFGTGLWALIAMEVQCVYYETLLASRETPARVADFAARYLRAEPGPDEQQLLDEAGIDPAERWDWARVTRPYGTGELRDLSAFRAWLRGYLDEDVRKAQEGNVQGPFKAALDILRDLRNEVRLAVDHGGLDAASHRDELDGWYTPLNAYLSIGPPASRIEEMAALIDAGVLDVTGPGLRVAASDGEGGPCFVATSTEIADVRVRATALIEARLPDIDLRRTADPLMTHLLATGQCGTYRVPGTDGTDYETGGLAVSPRPCRLLDAHGTPHPRRFAYGVPTESVHWVTAAGIRPGVGSVTLEESDDIAAAVLSLPEPALAQGRLPGRAAPEGAEVGR